VIANVATDRLRNQRSHWRVAFGAIRRAPLFTVALVIVARLGVTPPVIPLVGVV
jgi:hypothetical protein